jgi:hypothetical protein
MGSQKDLIEDLKSPLIVKETTLKTFPDARKSEGMKASDTRKSDVGIKRMSTVSLSRQTTDHNMNFQTSMDRSVRQPP